MARVRIWKKILHNLEHLKICCPLFAWQQKVQEGRTSVANVTVNGVELKKG